MIFFDEAEQSFYLESKDTTYAFCISKFGFLQHLYFGKRIAREDLSHTVCHFSRGHSCNIAGARRDESLNVYANECPTYGRSDYRQSMLATCDEKGVRVGDWKYVSHEVLQNKPALAGMPSVRGKETLAVTLRDERLNAEMRLYYTVFEDLPVILRHMEILNCGTRPFSLDRAYSFCLDLPDDHWEAITLPGAHMRERFTERTKLSHGTFCIESKRGVSSGQMNPFIALARRNTDERQGEVYGFNLVYSGSFAFKTETEQDDALRIVGGINDYDFSWELRPEDRFTTPEAVMVYSSGGLGAMSRAFHDLYRDYLVNPRFSKEYRPIVLNNWEATYMDFTTEKLCTMIDSIKGTGIDTFVLDDGWFGARNNDRCSLGDWFVDLEKLPQGLTPVIEHAHANGLKFGLWFEPEMISENSDLYRAHPDWALHVDGMEPCTGRDQLLLDLTRDEVCDYVIEAVSKILRENQIDYVKWDMNRPMTENYSAHLGKNAKETQHRYVLGLYRICDAVVNGFPDVFFEGCAGGGSRFDPAMLSYFPQIWTSDDSDAYLRTVIQYGTSLCYPLPTHSCHVSVCPNHQCGRVTPFEARGDIAHLGATGYELDTTKCTADEMRQIREQVIQYKEIRDLVMFGDLYRLNDPLKENLFCEMVVSKDRKNAFLTMMRPICIPNPAAIRIYPEGLDPESLYECRELGITRHGSTWMNAGLLISVPKGDFRTKTIRFHSVCGEGPENIDS